MIEPSNHALVPPGPLSDSTGPGAIPAARSAARSTPPHSSAGASFADALAHAGTELKFSRHAAERVQRRGIELDRQTLDRLSDGVTRAAGKGARESLVIVDGTAFVVAVGSRTVVTAVGSEHMKDNVFTNIDSAVIA